MKVVLCAPPTLLPNGMKQWIENCGLDHISLDANLDSALENADVVMPLRLQKERQQSGLISYTRVYSFIPG
jgi:aspartate carbamoyltransferase catalytic subunit